MLKCHWYLDSRLQLECCLQELISFSHADLERSIPSMVDGLKPGQRKILFSCFKKKLKSDIKASILDDLSLSSTAGF